MDTQSLAHSRYNCTYHIVFIPKYRRKVMFGKLRKEVGDIIGKVCRMEEVTVIKGATLPDHVHMYVSIPPKLSVAKVVGRMSALVEWYHSVKDKNLKTIAALHAKYESIHPFWEGKRSIGQMIIKSKYQAKLKTKELDIFLIQILLKN